jgi:RNA polymerase sporulation-specific sigma factor
MNMPPDMVTYADNEQLLRLAKTGDEQALAQLYQLNQGLIRMVAERFRYSHYEYEELLQIGAIGLLKAAERFDSSFNVKFSTYAVPMIIGEIKKFLRDDGLIKVQRGIKENYGKIRWAQEHLRQQLDREAAIGEIAALLDMDPETILFALDACQTPSYLSEALDEGSPLLERLPVKDDSQQLVEHMALDEALEHLPPREQEILRRRFFKEETQMVIAEKLGISQVQVSRLEKSALLKLKQYLA